MSVNDFLNEREIKLANRNSILQSNQFNFLRVLLLGYERSKTSDTPQKLEWTQKQIDGFIQREMMER